MSGGLGWKVFSVLFNTFQRRKGFTKMCQITVRIRKMWLLSKSIHQHRLQRQLINLPFPKTWRRQIRIRPIWFSFTSMVLLHHHESSTKKYINIWYIHASIRNLLRNCEIKIEHAKQIQTYCTDLNATPLLKTSINILQNDQSFNKTIFL